MAVSTTLSSTNISSGVGGHPQVSAFGKAELQTRGHYTFMLMSQFLNLLPEVKGRIRPEPNLAKVQEALSQPKETQMYDPMVRQILLCIASWMLI